jgi:glycosyltransferase involved in cell wall biosynthesis
VNPSDDTISVLLPVHAGVDAAHLDQAIGSLLTQTRPPDEVVVVEDGPLEPSQLRLLDRLEERMSPRVVRLRLQVNQGAGVANDAGLRAASGTWIAKADADDINLPHRLATQLAAVRSTSVDVCGAAMGEFEEASSVLTGVRKAPLTHEAVARRMRWNNPINHPTAFYRREVALRVGGYPAMRYMQDYDLFARMLAGGARMLNLADVLVLFRADPAMFERRAALAGSTERELQRNLHRYGITSRAQRVRNLVLRQAFRRLPRGVMRRAHALLFRRGPAEPTR